MKLAEFAKQCKNVMWFDVSNITPSQPSPSGEGAFVLYKHKSLKYNYITSKRGVRAVDGAILEGSCGSNSTVGSNPIPSVFQSTKRELVEIYSLKDARHGRIEGIGV